MATKNPRITITLKPSIAAHLRRLSELTGNSQSALIADLLEGSESVFERMIQVLEAAKSAKAAMKGKLANDMEKAQATMEGALGIALEGFDTYTGSLLDEAEAVQRRARRGGHASAAQAPRAGVGAASPTPLSNRGVRSLTTTTKKIATGPEPLKPKPTKSSEKNRGVGK